MVSDDVGDLWFNQSLKNDSIVVMENEVFEDMQKYIHYYKDPMDLDGIDLHFYLRDVL